MTVRQLLKLCVLGAFAAAVVRTPADPDLWGHVRFGQDMLRSLTITRTDTYAFTSQGYWINHEWLSEILMALSFNLAGTPGLIVLRLSLITAILLLVWRRLRATGAPVLLGVGVTALSILPRSIAVRPQLFSMLLFTGLLDVLACSDEKESRAFVFVPFLMIPWVNLHGGWIVGLGTFLLWSFVRLLAPSTRVSYLGLVKQGPSSGSRWQTVTVAIAAISTTLINPYGLGMWRFVMSTVGFERPMIGDWQPLFALSPVFWIGWLAPLSILLLVAATKKPIRVTWVVIVLLLGLATLRVSRLDAFFALSTIYLLAPTLATGTVPLNRGAGGETRMPIPRWVTTGVIATVSIVLARYATTIEIRTTITPEPEAVKYMRANRLSGRMLTWFDWGEYSIWHLSPAIKVSMDGRRETVYDEECISDHLNFYFGVQDASDYADRIGADYIWIPKALPVVRTLTGAGWRLGFEGPISVVLIRQAASLPTEIVHSVPTPRPFPGP
jgi:hypothetical protein